MTLLKPSVVAFVMRQTNLNSLALDLAIDRLHPPKVIEAAHPGVMQLKSVHFSALPDRRLSMNQPRSATEIPDKHIFIASFFSNPRSDCPAAAPLFL